MKNEKDKNELEVFFVGILPDEKFSKEKVVKNINNIKKIHFEILEKIDEMPNGVKKASFRVMYKTFVGSGLKLLNFALQEIKKKKGWTTEQLIGHFKEEIEVKKLEKRKEK